MRNSPHKEVFDEIDEQRVRQFELLWLTKQQPYLDDFLPESSSGFYAGTLEELIHVQLEFEWNNAAGCESGVACPADWLRQQLAARSELSANVRIRLIAACAQLAANAGRPISESEILSLFDPYVDRDALEAKLKEVWGEMSFVLQPGSALGQYQLDEFAGQGGFGVVWRATDTRLGRRVAVKHLGRKLGLDAEFRRRFEREARVTARLQHPGVVPVYDVSLPEDTHSYYAMRLIEGQTLEHAIVSLHQLPSETDEFRLGRSRLLQAFIDVCQTMEYAHSEGVLHRDLKPSNIIVGDYGETVILDWGLAGVIDTASAQQRTTADAEVVSEKEVIQTLTGNLEGTPGYMPPEQAQSGGEKFQITSDVYSLGATLYHLATGEPPFRSDGDVERVLRAIREADFPKPSDRKPGLEFALSAVVEKAMNHKCNERYLSVRDLRQDLERFAADRPVSVLKEPAWERSARWIRRHPAKASAGFLSLLFALIFSFMGWTVVTAWQQQEEDGRRAIVRSIEESREIALAQLKTDRFADAASVLSSSLQRTSGRFDSGVLWNEVSQIRARANRLAEFERLANEAQAAAFSDQLHRSAVFCQEALRQVEAFEHPDWWAHLPDQNLDARQRHQLQWRVYRVICLLAAMRLSETSSGVYSFQQLLDPREIDDLEVKNVLRSAASAADMANRFRPARGMRLVKEAALRMAGEGSSIDMTKLAPLNSVDAAMMGSILDNNVPESGIIRAAVSGFLSLQDPSEVANRWLNDGLRNNPRWYWLPVFVGLNQTRRGQPQLAVRTLTHAVGIQDNNWVGYHYRAYAEFEASREKGVSPALRRDRLMSARHDLNRALDCDSGQADIYWLTALVLNEDGSEFEQVAAAFLQALELESLPRRFEAAHFRSTRKRFLQRAQLVLGNRDRTVVGGPRTLELQAALALWRGETELAVEKCHAALEAFPQEARLLALADLLEGRTGRSDLHALRVADRFGDAYRWHRALAGSLQTSAAIKAAQDSLQLAVTNWQKSESHLRIAEALLALSTRGNVDEGTIILHLEHAFSFDPVIDLQSIRDLADNRRLSAVTAFCDDIGRRQSPIVLPEVTIDKPALLNADFELSLLSGWTQSKDPDEPGRFAATAWSNRRGSMSSAVRSTENVKAGERSLMVVVDCPTDSAGWIQQRVPATDGEIYRVSCQVFSESGSTVKLRFQGEGSEWVDVNSETDGVWQLVVQKLDCEDGFLKVGIEVQGRGLIWIDDLRVQRITSGHAAVDRANPVERNVRE